MAWITQILVFHILVATSRCHFPFSNGFNHGLHGISDLPHIMSRLQHNLHHSFYDGISHGFKEDEAINLNNNVNQQKPTDLDMPNIGPGIIIGSQEFMDQTNNLRFQESDKSSRQIPSHLQVPETFLDADGTGMNTQNVDISNKQNVDQDLGPKVSLNVMDTNRIPDKPNILEALSGQHIDVVGQKVEKDELLKDYNTSGVFNQLELKNHENTTDEEGGSLLNDKNQNADSKLEDGLKTNQVTETSEKFSAGDIDIKLNKNRNKNAMVFPDEVDAAKVQIVKEKGSRNDSGYVIQPPNFSDVGNNENENIKILYAVNILPLIDLTAKPITSYSQQINESNTVPVTVTTAQSKVSDNTASIKNPSVPISSIVAPNNAITNEPEVSTNQGSGGAPQVYAFVDAPSDTTNNSPGQVYIGNNVPVSTGGPSNGNYQIPNTKQQYYTVQLSNGQTAPVPVNNGQIYVSSNSQNSAQSPIYISGNNQQYIPSNNKEQIVISGNGQQYVLSNSQQYATSSGTPVQSNGQKYVLSDSQPYVTSSGTPVQSNGQQYVLSNGQPYVTSSGTPVQSNGQQYVLSNGQLFAISSGTPVQNNGQQYVLSNGQQYVTSNSPPVQSNGQQYVLSNGQQYATSSGPAVQSNGQQYVLSNGQQYVTSNGQLIQSNGQPYVSNNGQKYPTSSGHSVSSNGQQYVLNTGQQYVPSNGQPVQDNGQKYLLINGQQYVLSSYPPVQSNGQPYILNNGQQYVMSSGQPLQSSSQISVSGNGEQYVPSNSQIVQGNEQIVMPENDLQYIQSNGQPTQGNGQQYVTTSGSSGYVAQSSNGDTTSVHSSGQVYVPVNSQVQIPQSNILTVPSGSVVTIGDSVPLLVLKDKEDSSSASTSHEERDESVEVGEAEDDGEKLKKF